MASYNDKIPRDLRERAEAKLEWCMKKLREKFPKASKGFKYPDMDYLKKGVVAGTACYSKNLISLNKVFLLEETEDMVEDTIPHEFAHLVTHYMFGSHVKQAHGKEWKMVCRTLYGKHLDRCHVYSTRNARTRKVTIKRYIYTCNCIGNAHMLTKNKHERCQLQVEHHQHTLYRCTKCHGYIKWNGTMTEYQK